MVVAVATSLVGILGSREIEKRYFGVCFSNFWVCIFGGESAIGKVCAS